LNSSHPEHGVKSSRCREEIEAEKEKKEKKREQEKRRLKPRFRIRSEADPTQNADDELKDETR
jgi:hypothetical protein